MILSILQEPDPRLRRLCQPVNVFTPQLDQILEDMLETMAHHQGIGLAAAQVNLTQRMVVMDVGQRSFKMVNPEIIWASADSKIFEEGCLSAASVTGKVCRPAQVRVRYSTPQNLEKIQEFEGLEAVCIQHEIDHLDGILFIDRLSPLKRSLAREKLRKRALR